MEKKIKINFHLKKYKNKKLSKNLNMVINIERVDIEKKYYLNHKSTLLKNKKQKYDEK